MYNRRKMREVKDTERRPSVVCSAKYAIKKALAGIRLSRWELEEISSSAHYSLEYSKRVLKGRFPEGEAAILQNPHICYLYALDVVGRWEEAEGVIAKHANAARRYADDVLKGRFPLGEPAILSDYNEALQYLSTTVRGRWVEFEERLVGFISGRKGDWRDAWVKRHEAIKNYMKVVSCRVPELEGALESRDLARCTYAYAVGVGGKLPGVLHQKMMMFSFDDKRKSWSRRYLKFLSRMKGRVEKYLSDMEPGERSEFLEKYR